MSTENISIKSGQDLTDAFLKAWLEKDYSWGGLKQHKAITVVGGSTLQDSIRSIHHPSEDERLASDGFLIPIRGTTYHVAFVPTEWTAHPGSPIDDSLLRRKKVEFWELFGKKVPAHVALLVQGVHIEASESPVLLNRPQVSFQDCYFADARAILLSNAVRTFTECLFTAQFRLSTNVSNPSDGSLSLQRCQFHQGADIELGKLRLALTINECSFMKSTQIRDISFSTLTIGNSAFDRFSLDDISVSRAFKISGLRAIDFELTNSSVKREFFVQRSSFEKRFCLWSNTFDARVAFNDNSWPLPGLSRVSSNDTKYNRLLEVSGEEAPPVQLFHQAKFEQGIVFEGIGDPDWRSSFSAEIAANRAAPQLEFNQHKYLETLAESLRTLRAQAVKVGDHHQEMLWHSFEMKVRRRAQTGSKFERFFSWLYEYTSDYGISVARPWIWLFGISFIFASFYALAVTGMRIAGIDYSAFANGISYSLERTLFFGAFELENETFKNALLGSGADLRSLGIRAIATIQSIMALSLIFIGVMSLRRKFRLSK